MGRAARCARAASFNRGTVRHDDAPAVSSGDSPRPRRSHHAPSIVRNPHRSFSRAQKGDHFGVPALAATNEDSRRGRRTIRVTRTSIDTRSRKKRQRAADPGRADRRASAVELSRLMLDMQAA
jgi:hypothetical protein